ncbi:conserved hypothetical protein [Anaeromyxobacter sp. K]|nr:conserved hypothetical protein [Anaeromyxobacter sp. K]
MPWKLGALVEHPAFGIGRVVGTQATTVHVYFHSRGGKCATRLALDAATKFLRASSSVAHEWLDHLPAFEFDPRKGTYCMEHDRLTHEQAVATFLQTFPKGFDDPAYIGDLRRGERAYKLAVVAEWDRSFGHGEGERLLDNGNIDELRRRLMHIAQINLLHPKWEKAPLKDALADDAAAVAYVRAILASAREAPSQQRFEDILRSLQAMPTPGSEVAKWPLATIFPYLAASDRHMFLRPAPTVEAAKRLGFELNYKSEPNWRTYSSLLALARNLLDELRRYGAKDFLDVQSFIFVTWLPGYTT